MCAAGKLFCLLLLPLLTLSQVIPSRYFFPTAKTVSVNGSSAIGNCSSVTTGVGTDGSLSRCDAPTSSVLFDGNVPTLTGLDGDTWASQLLTIQTTSVTAIAFDFTGKPDCVEWERVEVVMFNCPERGIAINDVQWIYINQFGHHIIGLAQTSNTSCDSLVRVSIMKLPGSEFSAEITLEFHPSSQNPADWMHLAEVVFYADTSTCPPAGTNTTDEMTAVIKGSSTPPSPDFTTMQCQECPSHPPSCPPQSEVCSSCSTSTLLAVVFTAIVTALLATVIFVLVPIAVSKYHRKSTPGGAKTGTPAGGEEEYEQMDGGGEVGVAVSDPTYSEIGAGRGNTFEVKENEAYM